MGQLYQGDLDLGRVVVACLQARDLGSYALVEDLYYGAVAVAQRLEELAPDRLILVGAEQRGRRPGAVERRRVHPPVPGDPHRAVEQAVVGYVSIDLALSVASGFGVLPEATVAIEVEPATIEPSERLSPTAQGVLEEVLRLVELEVGRLPLFKLAGDLEPLVYDQRLDDSPALLALRDLLAELHLLDEEARWGRSLTLRDRLRYEISLGRTSEGMDHRDWALWWTLIEELDRLEKAEVALYG